ncbi:hypothetical protein [Paraglaciecola sp. MB-3u-78]|jgi:hypothetical protein|uniref:hypothetical protein n=1 Tax=Paraglaciecola sp. MB-3u-78 TaxID=2058332 RepID=UPI000C325E1A|nr:hypothetical protein [Paraglaciecola sp. MB-3u-78]PKG99270.1 hypothetical protein CXF95_08335 [Paraglaciecola sp. MB-3u-78]
MKVISFITKILILTGSLLLIQFQAMAQNAAPELNPCISKDPALGDSAYWANTSIELYTEKKYKEAIKTVDACFNQWASGAVKLQSTFNNKKVKAPPLGKFTESEKKEIHDNYLLNDVSLALWVKARSLEETNEIELAKKMYSNCIFLTHGRAWDPKGWFWNPSADCIKRGRKLLK